MINKILKSICTLIDHSQYKLAKEACDKLLLDIAKIESNEKLMMVCFFNIAGYYIDIGQFMSDNSSSQKGVEILENHQELILKYIPKSKYYYNYANGKSNLVSIKSPSELSFNNIEELIEIKDLYWKAYKENINETDDNPQLLVNLANSLKRQFRVSEALRYYDVIINRNLDIFPAYTNRSETLVILNEISNTFSAKLISEIAKGYKQALCSKSLPPEFADFYNLKYSEAIAHLKHLGFNSDDKTDELETENEFNALSIKRKFYLSENLTLSEHALYCPCIGSSRDNLTIPLSSTTIGGLFIPQMELALNRIKSEFSLARSLYYDYFLADKNYSETKYEDCYTDLRNDEILGNKIEKIRTSFKICFSILDKIAISICELYKIETKGEIYFHNFWKLDYQNNREKFEKFKNPSLLALYSIATDLNSFKNGEWSHFKEWRNSLEHGFLVILKNNHNKLDPYNSLETTCPIIVTCESDFLNNLKELLQLTRSAIFSYVFCVRQLAFDQNEGGILNTLSFEN